MLINEVLRMLSKQMELFDRAVSFSGRPRERIVALGEAEEIYFRLYPNHYRAMQIIRIASQLARGTGLRDEAACRCENHLHLLLMRVIRDAEETGDLQLIRPDRPEELAFTFWALAFGTRALMRTGVATRNLGANGGFQVAHDVVDMFMDSLGWRPLTTEWDYPATRKRIHDELFAPEWKRITSAPAN